MAGFRLVQAPPDVGNSCEVCPVQIDCGPVILTEGLGRTVIFDVGNETQPVDTCVKIKCAVPADIPVINPLLLMVATAGLDEIQVPPVAGVAVAVPAIQTD
jgi:hypothetical protein